MTQVFEKSLANSTWIGKNKLHQIHTIFTAEYPKTNATKTKEKNYIAKI